MNKAVFLDRDGVINIDHGYTSKPEDFEFIPGVFEMCQTMQASGYKLVVVTNQSGIGRGYYTEETFLHLSQWMKERFLSQGIDISGIYFCPHHPHNAQGEYLQDCECRKPQPGMLLQATRELELDLSRSVMIGDKESDVQAGKAAGVKTLVRIADSDVESDADQIIRSLIHLDWKGICE